MRSQLTAQLKKQMREKTAKEHVAYLDAMCRCNKNNIHIVLKHIHVEGVLRLSIPAVAAVQ